MRSIKWLALFLALISPLLYGCNSGGRGGATQFLPNMGQQITPLAPQDSQFETLNPDLADKPDWLAGQAVVTVVSPDNTTLLVLTSGYNRVFDTSTPMPSRSDSNEYVFIYDISQSTPVKKRVLQIPNTYSGMVFDPSGKAFYASGGSDDNIHIFSQSTTGRWQETGAALPLDHNKTGNGLVGLSDAGAGSINL